jgi:hypothetical protein
MADTHAGTVSVVTFSRSREADSSSACSAASAAAAAACVLLLLLLLLGQAAARLLLPGAALGAAVGLMRLLSGHVWVDAVAGSCCCCCCCCKSMKCLSSSPSATSAVLHNGSRAA